MNCNQQRMPLIFLITKLFFFIGMIFCLVKIFFIGKEAFDLFQKIKHLENFSYIFFKLLPFFGFLVSFNIINIGIKMIRSIFHISTENTEIIKEEVEKKANEMSSLIFNSAFTYLKQQYKYILIIAFIFILIFLYFSVAMCIGFILGIFFTSLVSIISMYISVITNIRTAISANISISEAFKVASKGSLTGGLITIASCLLCLLIIYFSGEYFLLKFSFCLSDLYFGTSFGSIFICLFSRLAGGIFTKAADVGADLVGKIEKELSEDDSKNPAVIADNVGDNIGDGVGMITDIFSSYLTTFLMALLWKSNQFLSTISNSLFFNEYLVFIIFFISIIGLFITLIFPYVIKLFSNIWNKLQGYFYISSFLINIFSILSIYFFGKIFSISSYLVYRLIFCNIIGIILSILILKITEYYTSYNYSPVKNLAKSSNFGHGSNVIYGLSISFYSVALPILISIIGIITSYVLLKFLGIIFVAISMLSISGVIISLDLMGPITDNAGGIVEMSEMPEETRQITDYLDALGNTNKATTKGFSIIISTFTALLGLIILIEEILKLKNIDVICNLLNPLIFCGFFIGGIITYVFTGLTLVSVGEAAQAVVENIREQIKNNPEILTGEKKPDYLFTINYLTKTSLKKMILPVFFFILIPISSFYLYQYIYSLYMVYDFLLAIGFGIIITGIFNAISMTTSGGAWDNSKKYIENGFLGGKKSFSHLCAITGDTVGDPYKDTCGPSLNALIKLVIPFFYFIIAFCNCI